MTKLVYLIVFVGLLLGGSFAHRGHHGHDSDDDDDDHKHKQYSGSFEKCTATFRNRVYNLEGLVPVNFLTKDDEGDMILFNLCGELDDSSAEDLGCDSDSSACLVRPTGDSKQVFSFTDAPTEVKEFGGRCRGRRHGGDGRHHGEHDDKERRERHHGPRGKRHQRRHQRRDEDEPVPPEYEGQPKQERGLTLSYVLKSSCSENCYLPSNATLTFVLTCDPNSVGQDLLNMTSVTLSEIRDQVNISIRSAAACPMFQDIAGEEYEHEGSVVGSFFFTTILVACCVFSCLLCAKKRRAARMMTKKGYTAVSTTEPSINTAPTAIVNPVPSPMVNFVPAFQMPQYPNMVPMHAMNQPAPYFIYTQFPVPPTAPMDPRVQMEMDERFARQLQDQINQQQ